MALKKTIDLPNGISITDAYIRVENVTVDKLQMTWKIAYYVEIGKSAFQTDMRTGAYNIQGSNPIAQAYLNMKSMPEFADAIDC